MHCVANPMYVMATNQYLSNRKWDEGEEKLHDGVGVDAEVERRVFYAAPAPCAATNSVLQSTGGSIDLIASVISKLSGSTTASTAKWQTAVGPASSCGRLGPWPITFSVHFPILVKGQLPEGATAYLVR